MDFAARKLPSIYKIQGNDGRCYTIYCLSGIGNPLDHVAENWCAGPYPTLFALLATEPFETATAAERAIPDWFNQETGEVGK